MSLVLGIETSCDDTSVAVLEDGARLRSHLIAAQDLHQLYGGVVPELAARAHVELLPRMVGRALEERGFPEIAGRMERSPDACRMLFARAMAALTMAMGGRP